MNVKDLTQENVDLMRETIKGVRLTFERINDSLDGKHPFPPEMQEIVEVAAAETFCKMEHNFSFLFDRLPVLSPDIPEALRPQLEEESKELDFIQKLHKTIQQRLVERGYIITVPANTALTH